MAQAWETTLTEVEWGCSLVNIYVKAMLVKEQNLTRTSRLSLLWLLPWKTLKLISTNHFLHFLKTFIVEVLIQVLIHTLPALKFLNIDSKDISFFGLLSFHSGFSLWLSSRWLWWSFIFITAQCSGVWIKIGIVYCKWLPTGGHYKQCYHTLWVSAVFFEFFCLFVSLMFKYFMFLVLL